MNQQLQTGMTQQEVINSYESLKYFINNVYPHSFVGKEQFKRGDHIDEWSDMLQEGNTCIISARKHSKSVTIYGYLMWEMWRHPAQDLEISYNSYKPKLAQYHIGKFKQGVRNNPLFGQLQDLTPSHVEGVARYSWDGKHKITVLPGGILTFERGKHPDILVLDDVLADPADALNFGIINKINRLVKEVSFSLPKEGGTIKCIGTAQTPIDFLFELKKAPHFNWGMYEAITNWKAKEVLWPEMFNWERLMQIRNYEVGHKGFEKEYMCKPVWSADSFFSQTDIDLTVNPNLKNYNSLTTKNDVGIGWDIGKHSHPAYVTAFEFIPMAKDQDVAVQRHIMWMEGWDYPKQLDYVKGLVERLRGDWVNYDNTRGEMEGFYDKGYMDKTIFHPVNFSVKTKSSMAVEYEKRVMNETLQGNRSPTVMHINHQRSINQILVVTNDLHAVATHEGHGDSFWGNALALWENKQGRIAILGDEENVTGLY